MARLITRSLPMRRLAPLVLLFLAACSSTSFTSYLPTPYKVDLQQGNVITQDMMAKLKPGMSKSQVRFILGSPPVTDMFHANRWDYVYILKVSGKVKEQRKLTLFFDNDQLTRVAGDVVAATQEDKAAEDAKPAKAPTEIVLQKFDPNAPLIPSEDEKGFFGRMLEKIGF
jgi:outer membrane protein assembly factor BamE